MSSIIPQRYELYKDSGVEWIGEVPDHWNIVRTKEVFCQSKRLVGEESGKYKVLSLTLVGVIERNIETASGKFPASFDGYQIIEPDSLILCLFDMDVTPRIVGIVRQTGIITAAYTNIRPRFKICVRYYYYYFLNQDRNKSLLAHGKGLRSTLRFDSFGSLSLPLPPLLEQQAIADYLDAKTAQIDRKIELLTQKAAKYRQLKQSVINAAVTRGLDESVPMKDSGVEWIGEVPAHWVVGRLKDFVRVNPTSRMPRNVHDDVLVEFVPMANVDEQLGQIRSFERVPLRDVVSGYKRFQNGDVIFARITPCMENGNCAIVQGLAQYVGFGSTEFQVYRPLKGITSQYLHYFLHNESFRRNAEPHMRGSAGQKRVPSEYIETHGFALPPLSEQRAIDAFLNEQTTNLDRIIEVIKAQTTKLAVLRKSLINDVVTGKLRVT